MKTVLRSLVLVGILSLGMMVVGCDGDNGNENGKTTGGDDGQKIVAEQYRGTFDQLNSLDEFINGGSFTRFVITADKVSVLGMLDSVNIAENTSYRDMPAWTEGNSLIIQSPTQTTWGTFESNDVFIRNGGIKHKRVEVIPEKYQGTYRVQGHLDDIDYEYFLLTKNSVIWRDFIEGIHHTQWERIARSEENVLYLMAGSEYRFGFFKEEDNIILINERSLFGLGYTDQTLIRVAE